MEIFRSLYRSEPGVYADRVQAQAMLLAGKRQGEGRHAEAAALYGEAGEALTRLPLRDPGRQLQLGLALQLQAQELSLARAPFASVVHLLERSCAVLGSLFRQDPEMIADPYFDLLKHFVQGAQLVAEDIDIKPYMAEVAGVLDHIVSRWEAAGRIPGVVTTVGNLAMYVSWAIEEGDLTSAIRLCERVEAIAPDDSGATAHLDRENFHATMMMLRAKAMARRGDLPEAAVVATAAAERLDACATPDNPWAAVVAAEGLLDLSLRMSVTDAPRETIALNQAGSAIALRHMAEALDDWTPSSPTTWPARHEPTRCSVSTKPQRTCSKWSWNTSEASPTAGKSNGRTPSSPSTSARRPSAPAVTRASTSSCACMSWNSSDSTGPRTSRQPWRSSSS